MPDYTYDWFSPNINALKAVLEPIAHLPGLRALEIGCFEGLSTNWFMDNILDGNGSSIVCVDTFEGGSDHKELGIDMSTTESRFKLNTVHLGGRVRLLKMTSFRALTTVNHEPYNFIYVDGSHDPEDILSDAVLSWPLLKPGGIMVFDDYGWGNHLPQDRRPKVAVDAFRACYSRQLRTLNEAYQVAVRKEQT